MNRTIYAAIAGFLLGGLLWAQSENRQSYPSFDYDVARAHEIKPHHSNVPVEGVLPGDNQLQLKLVVSPIGDVVTAASSGDEETLKSWPQVEPEVRQWKFTPFEVNGKPTTAEVEEYVDLVPPERFPKVHVAAPMLTPTSKVAITLQRSGCYGSCPSYAVTVDTNGVVIFRGGGWVVASGRHMATVDPDAVRNLAKRFISANFYSMDSKYVAGVTDNSTYILSITVDCREKKVVDYVGSWVGMPEIVSDLEDEVDELARTQRWIDGSDGLVQVLRAEKFNFRTFAAQVMLKEAAARGEAATVREFLETGVPLDALPAPKPHESSFEGVGWLAAGSNHPDVLRVLIDAGASKNDQADKNLALAGAARAGKVEAARALIAYGANPNADLSNQTVIEFERGAGMFGGGKGAGSILFYAAESGNPEMVREILRYHPKLEARDADGRTAMFAAGEYFGNAKDAARAECVRLLAQAGANVNARDKDGNTPLHETFLTEVEAELLKLGANVNARNNDGETPIFTTVDYKAIPLFIEHGADLTIRNKKGETVMEAAKEQGPERQKVLREAIEKLRQP